MWASAGGREGRSVDAGSLGRCWCTRSLELWRRLGTCWLMGRLSLLNGVRASLEEVHRLALLTSGNIVSIGASLDHVHVPGRARPDPSADELLATEEIEVGMGIHNEAGSHRERLNLPELVSHLLNRLLDWTDEDRAFLNIRPDDQILLLINNLGGVSMLEMGGIVTEVVTQLHHTYGIKPVRILSGTYMTSLNGMGFSITLLRMQATGLGVGREMMDLLDAPAGATGWPSIYRPRSGPQDLVQEDVDTDEADGVMASNFQSGHPTPEREWLLTRILAVDPARAKAALMSGLDRLIAAEPEITRYDTVVGDGDCGVGLRRGAQGERRADGRAPGTDRP